MSAENHSDKKSELTFALAEMHYRVAQLLLEYDSKDMNDRDPSLMPSAFTLYSLAIELY